MFSTKIEPQKEELTTPWSSFFTLNNLDLRKKCFPFDQTREREALIVTISGKKAARNEFLQRQYQRKSALRNDNELYGYTSPALELMHLWHSIDSNEGMYPGFRDNFQNEYQYEGDFRIGGLLGIGGRKVHIVISSYRMEILRIMHQFKNTRHLSQALLQQWAKEDLEITTKQRIRGEHSSLLNQTYQQSVVPNLPDDIEALYRGVLAGSVSLSTNGNHAQLTDIVPLIHAEKVGIVYGKGKEKRTRPGS